MRYLSWQSEKLIEALKLIITNKEKTSKEIINEGNESRDVDESKLVDVEPENKSHVSFQPSISGKVTA